MTTAWERWELVSFDEAQQKKAATATQDEIPAVNLPTAQEIEHIYQQAREDGWLKGKEDGTQAGFKEGQKKALAEAQRFTHLIGKLDKSLSDLDATVADELLALAVELAREVIRQEISARPDILLEVVREALALLPHQHAAIYLHPDDASLLRSYMGDQLTHAGHRIHEDSKLARGDCMLEAGNSEVDATLAMRWRRVIEGLGVDAAWQPAAVPPAPTFESGEREGTKDGEQSES